MTNLHDLMTCCARNAPPCQRCLLRACSIVVACRMPARIPTLGYVSIARAKRILAKGKQAS